MPLTIGVLHPGSMGVTVAAAARTLGARVLWSSEARSDSTRKRAQQSRLEDAGSLAAIVEQADVIIAVCPPHAAVDMASQVAGLGFNGQYIEANAISPATTARINEIISTAGGRFVDGGIIGPPANREGTTRLYLSGPEAVSAATIFSGSLIEPVVLDERIGTASTFKVCYAAYNKGNAALMLLIRALADKEGMDPALMKEWGLSQPPGLQERSELQGRNFAPRAWRFVGEMEEIAETFEQHGLTGGFHRAAGEVYKALAGFRGSEQVTEFEQILQCIQDYRSAS
jgi:3-hydroxyisobutyrate dehydrogenase-like beta-hydroxyacid dehydrogenase